MNDRDFSRAQRKHDNLSPEDFFPDEEACCDCGNELDDCECCDE